MNFPKKSTVGKCTRHARTWGITSRAWIPRTRAVIYPQPILKCTRACFRCNGWKTRRQALIESWTRASGTQPSCNNNNNISSRKEWNVDLDSDHTISNCGGNVGFIEALVALRMCARLICTRGINNTVAFVLLTNRCGCVRMVCILRRNQNIKE